MASCYGFKAIVYKNSICNVENTLMIYIVFMLIFDIRLQDHPKN